MTNEIQKQYDRLDDVPSIMLRMKEVYAVPDRHIRYATTKAFFGIKMAEGSSVQSHGVKMLSPVEKLDDLKVGLENDTYIDVILQSLPPSYDPFIINYNMNGLDKSIHELINMLTEKGKAKVLKRSRKLSKDEMILRLGDGKAVVAEVVGSLSLAIWHARLGHISKDRIRKLEDSKSLEVDDLDHLPTCGSCLKGKMTKKPFVGQSVIDNSLLDLVHTDVCGPLNTPARGGFSYFITFTDDHSRYGYVYLMRYKSEAFGRFKEYRLEVENQTSRKIKALQSDRGGEYLSGEFIDYLKENGILSQWTPPEMPQLNRVAERRNQTLYLRVWGNPAYIKRLVGGKLDSKSSLCSVPVLRRSIRESRVPERYGFVGLTNKLDNNPKTYGEAMSDIDSDKWLEAMKSEMESTGSNQV
ncbi:UNVERIFIED_CONTAM: hypothetical protein Slati_0853400 [Sesamum latifolium]|uniref:Integrase catalytic domain-containing protein n=1 Tax=Sesamum latifolium TaxID=2727402 RepID=A0AAW2XLY6_9LAMI